MIVLKNILVATDFGEVSDAALNYGRDLARSYGATLHVLHAVDNAVVRFAADGPSPALADLQAAVEKVAGERLHTLVTDEDRRQLHARAVVKTSMAPAESIVTYAQDHAIDLIVMGTHGHKALAHLLMGSVAERVVRTASCPVLTVKHPEREFLAPDALAVYVTA